MKFSLRGLSEKRDSFKYQVPPFKKYDGSYLSKVSVRTGSPIQKLRQIKLSYFNSTIFLVCTNYSANFNICIFLGF